MTWRAAIGGMLRGHCAVRTSLRGLASRRLCSTVSIDVSRLPKRTPHTHTEYAPNTLLKSLATQMRVRGPMSVKEFMTAALTHPVHGYYMQHSEVFGRQGDFVTSPELSQVFGELLGVWCVASWEALGRPAQLRLIEMGPGKGTLMADVLRSTSIFAPFQDALQVDFVEVSAHLRAAQRQTLLAASGAEEEVQSQSVAGVDASAATASAASVASALPPSLLWRPAAPSAPSVAVHWHSSLEDVPRDADTPELVLAHEFLDALPVHQLVQTPRGWLERLVDLSEHAKLVQQDAEGGGGGGGGDAAAGQGTDAEWRDLDADERALDFVVSPSPTPASVLFGPRMSSRQGAADGPTGGGAEGACGGAGGDADGGVVASVLGAVEVCPGAISFMQQLCRRLKTQRGAALLIDYGGDDVPRDSLRGILGHRAVHPLHAPGSVDLSVDVDFGALRDVARDEGGSALRCPPLATQRDFLAAMGLEARVNALLRKTPDDRAARQALVQSASRLVASPGMGTAYKVFAIAHADVGSTGVAGFGEAPVLAPADGTEAEANPPDDDDDLPDPAAGRKIRLVR